LIIMFSHNGTSVDKMSVSMKHIHAKI
jgi:hypothetical protein